MQQIIDVHYPGIQSRLVKEAMEVFFGIREIAGLKKKPSTSELLDWLKLLTAEDVSPETLNKNWKDKSVPPLHGALLKNEQDMKFFDRILGRVMGGF